MANQTARIGHHFKVVALLALMFVVASAIMACATGPIDRDTAIRLATEEIGPAATAVLSVRNGPPSSVTDNPHLQQRGRAVWAVTFAGEWPGSCPISADMADKACANMRTAVVIIDYYTGELLSIEMR